VPTFGPDFVMFFGGVRLGGDIQVWSNRDIGILLRPSGLVGGGLYSHDRRNTIGLFVLQPSFDVRLAVANRLMHVWARPLSFDLLFFPGWYDTRDTRISAAYAPMVGIDFNF
jgi:hypothetical protein